MHCLSSQEVFAWRKFFCWISKGSAWKTRTVNLLMESSRVTLYIRWHGRIDPKHSWKRVCHDKISLQEGSSNQTNCTIWRACFRGEVWRKSIQAQIEGDERTEFNLCFQSLQIILKSMLNVFQIHQASYVEKPGSYRPPLSAKFFKVQSANSVLSCVAVWISLKYCSLRRKRFSLVSEHGERDFGLGRTRNVCAIFSQLHRLRCFFAFLRKLMENLKRGRRYWTTPRGSK